MSDARLCGNETRIPEGYSAIPLHASEAGATVRLCVLTRRAPDPAGGHLVLLRDLPDAMVYLGCLTDAGGRLREWIELWVQNVDGLAASLPALHEKFSNHSIDERWVAMCKSFCALNPEGFLETGWESTHPLPAFLDVSQGRPLHPGAPDKPWELCRDDAVLRAAGLPAYSTSLFRYLHQPSWKEAGFACLISGAPANPAARPVSEAVKEVHGRVPLNPQGGLLMAQTFSPLSYEEYVDLLGGKGWKGLEHGKGLIQFNGAYRGLEDWAQMQERGSHLFLGAQGRKGRFVEAFHLKLQLFVEAVAAVRSFVRDQQLPFLNLAADSFRVGLNEVGTKLPFLWTAKGVLVKPSEAYAFPVESSEFRYFIQARPGGTSIYYPHGIGASLRNEGAVRTRKVLPPEVGRTVVEGTLVMKERLKVSPHDLLWVRLPLSSGRVDLYGHLSAADGLAQDETRFRTVPQVLPPEVVNALRASEGIAFPASPFEVVPLLSTPCDLYALGVLAARTFLVNPQHSLPEALDDLLSLARRVAAENSETPLAARITAIMNSDAKFGKSLSPHRLTQEPMEPMAAYELLPPELWHQLLTAIVRFFPGLGSDSHCKDYGDAPSLALEVVFNKPLEELEKLLVRSRSLIVIDWHANREVHSAIRDFLDREHA